MDYKEPEFYTHSNIKKISHSDNTSDICNMLVGVTYNEPNAKYAYQLICKYLDHPNIQVMSLAIICIAHIARIHGTVPINPTIELFVNLITGPLSQNKEISGRIGDAVSDFSIYQKDIYNHLTSKFPDYFKNLGLI